MANEMYSKTSTPRERSRELTIELSDAIAGVGGREGAASSARVGSAFSAVEDRIALLLQERTGMADELLRVYEQLGVVSDVTRKLLTLHYEADVYGLFVESLRTTYRDEIFVTVRDEDGVDVIDGDMHELPSWVREGVAASRVDRRVRVVNPGRSCGVAADGAVQWPEQALVAPVFAGDVFTCALVLWRRSDDGPVTPLDSSEMLLFDSLTAFCGDAVQNFRLLNELRQMSMEMVRTLVNAVDQKDPYTSGHSNRVGYFAKLLAAELGFDKEELRTLEYAALLHDIGKIGIRDDVLKKPGSLTEAEFEHIKEHPLRGYHVVRENPHMREMLDGVLYHHERYDGKGYPEGLRGDEIPLQARIIQIADIFDALTTTRSYRGAFTWQKALSILEEESGKVVHPELSAKFVALITRLNERNPAAFEAIGKTNVSLCLTDTFEPSR